MDLQPISQTQLPAIATDVKQEEISHVVPLTDHVEDTSSSQLPHIIRTDSYRDDEHIKLGWRSWVVVFVCSFAMMAQTYVVVAAGSVIAFIVRDVGDTALSGWIIQGPLLMQSVLSPLVGRLSDVVDRKYLAAIPPLVSFVGAVISAKATSMNMLVVGGILIGVTLSSVAIVHAIPSEILPLKYRMVANGLGYIGSVVGGLIGGLGAGAVTNANASGWRSIFWMQAAFHLATSVGLFVFYWPIRPSNLPRLSLRQIIWACDPIGSFLFFGGATLMLLSLDWVGGAYHWADLHVAVPLSIGGALFIAFCFYEWKGRTDGLVAHVFFERDYNFALSMFAFTVEGWIFYSAVNSIVPQIVLHLGFEDNSWDISIRQLTYSMTTLLISFPIIWYSTRFKDLKSPLVITFIIFLAVSICYATINPNMSIVQIGYNVICGVGQAGPLSLLVACVQFTAPHVYLSTATGLAFSTRAIGGAFGSAVINAIVNGKLASTLKPQISAAATGAGLPSSSVAALLKALAAGKLPTNETVPGINSDILHAAVKAQQWAYAKAYRLAWASVIPFVVLAIIAVLFLKGVRELMTEHVEATVERRKVAEKEEA